MARLVWAVLFAVLSIGLTGAGARAATAGDFDYYVLSLAWSPTYCAASSRNRSTEQCREQHDIIVHGLWPQNERGYPSDCPTSYPLRLSSGLLDAYDAMTPDRGLLAHQWRKHGTCTGLSPEAYFETARTLFGRLHMPRVLINPGTRASFDRDDIRARIAAANPGLEPDMIVLTCEDRNLDEIRICFTREGDFRRCSADVAAKTCARKPMIVLPVSGR